MRDAPYHLFRPARTTTSVVFASPHSGRNYTSGFLRQSVLRERELRSSEDAFVDDLLEHAPAFGAPLLCATMPRAWLDLNRSCEELDPAVIEDVRPSAHNLRVTSGLGVIPRVVSGGRAIYRGKIGRAEAQGRIERFWLPYHTCLAALLDEAHAAFGEAILVDMHSMPHEAVDTFTARSGRRPEIVLGDRFGASAAADLVDRVAAAFEAAGLRTSRNIPFAGAYIAQSYGRPSHGRHAIQIEIDRSLYMNEREIRPNGNYAGFKRLLTAILSEIADLGRMERRLAAE